MFLMVSSNLELLSFGQMSTSKMEDIFQFVDYMLCSNEVKMSLLEMSGIEKGSSPTSCQFPLLINVQKDCRCN